MDIDLLFTDTGTAGLIADRNFIKKIAGVMLDAGSGILTLEYTDMDSLELNIPVEPEFFYILGVNSWLHVGAVKDGNIAQAYQAPLMLLGEPLTRSTQKSANPLLAFERFIKTCTGGQPVHREDLGDETATGCVLGDAMPSSLQFAPHLAQRHALEAAPKVAPVAAPRAPGLGLGGGGGGGHTQHTSRRPPTDENNE